MMGVSLYEEGVQMFLRRRGKVCAMTAFPAEPE